MKSRFTREITPPNIAERNRILRKLVQLRGLPPHIQKTLGPAIKKLRLAIHNYDGRTEYFRVHRGQRTPVGDETTPKKQFLLYKDARYLAPLVRQQRETNKPERVEVIKRLLREINKPLVWQRVGGVMKTPGFFASQVRGVKYDRTLLPKKPKTDDSYIGIELEYASKLPIADIINLIIDHKLENVVRVVRDGSIRTNEVFKHQVEFCILTKFSDLEKTIQALRPVIFDKPQYFMPNDSCGFHVHLDMRKGNVVRAFHNLASMQTLLFSLVAEWRRENRYCVPVETNFHDVDPEDHYSAVSRSSYEKHRTIEIRIHQSTLDWTRVEKWIKLLKRIADYAGDGLELGTADTEFEQLKTKVQIEDDLVSYIKERKGT